METGDDGFVSLRLTSGSTFNIQPNSRVLINEIQCLSDDLICKVELNTEIGEVESSVNHTPQQPAEFRIRTPYASAAVRGTVFNFSAQNNSTSVSVTEGLVGVGVDASESQVDVPEGFGVTVAANGNLGSPVSLLPRPSLNNLPQRVTDEDSVSWEPVSGARAYSIAYASDQAGNQVVLQHKSGSARHQVNALLPGLYYAKIEAYDAAGLRGFPSEIAVNRVALDDSLAKPTIKVEREEKQVFLSIVDNRQGNNHEVQVATKDDFSNAIFVDIPVDGSTAYVLQPDVLYYVRARAIKPSNSAGSYGPRLEIKR